MRLINKSLYWSRFPPTTLAIKLKIFPIFTWKTNKIAFAISKFIIVCGSGLLCAQYKGTFKIKHESCISQSKIYIDMSLIYIARHLKIVHILYKHHSIIYTFI